ncbi:MAG: hypothetical protein Q4G69_07225 [Planctomycetia bacterium]|nr:hypothetical protein [Planctomycetia bacterium]
MSAESEPKEDRVGFITVSGNMKQGFVGGYLLLNRVGRPLEFHCTTPVVPNRAQEILYGNTLRSYLFGDQIAQALLAYSKPDLSMIFTNLPEILLAQKETELPLIFILARKPDQVFSEENFREKLASVPGLIPDQWEFLSKDKYILVFTREKVKSDSSLSSQFDLLLASMEPMEPFDRIRSAVEEARKQ